MKHTGSIKKVALLSILGLFLILPSMAHAYVSTDIEQYWNFNDGTPTDLIHPASTTTQSGTTYDLTNGKFGKGVGFSGSSSYITQSWIPDFCIVPNTQWSEPDHPCSLYPHEAPNPTSTINLWFKPLNSTPQFGSLFDSRGKYISFVPIVQMALRTDISPNNFYNYFSDGYYYNINLNASTTAYDGNWHMATMTYTPHTAKIYFDGSLVTSSTTGNVKTPWNGQNLIAFGSYCAPDNCQKGWYYKGSLDDVVIFNKELSQSEITALWNGGTGTEISQALPPPTISISYPTGGNITCPANTFCSQPINWIFSANNLTAGSSTIVYINYQQGNSIDPTKYTNVDTLFFTPTSTIYSNSIQVGTYLTADLNYTARADLYIPPAGSPVATSTAITFSYSAGGYTYTTSTGFVGTTCNATSVDFFTGLLCSAFVPQQISLTQFNTLYTKVSNKPPIGYLSAISTLISGTSTATTAIDNLNIPAGTSSPFTILRSGMIWILWLLFGFWVFTKIRHFQLW
jgi:hypothetical protein